MALGWFPCWEDRLFDFKIQKKSLYSRLRSGVSRLGALATGGRLSFRTNKPRPKFLSWDGASGFFSTAWKARANVCNRSTVGTQHLRTGPGRWDLPVGQGDGTSIEPGAGRGSGEQSHFSHFLVL